MSRVITTLKPICERVRIEGQEISFVTSSHDQYAAMTAAGVRGDSLMLGTGTAWVINGKSNKLLYDQNALIHPGHDLHEGAYGYIVTMGAIGLGFDLLLKQLNTGYNDLSIMEDVLNRLPPPNEPLSITLTGKFVLCQMDDAPQTIRRYMEAAGSKVRYVLEKMNIRSSLKKLLMTGGAASGKMWPQIIANICQVPVEAICFDALCAYGAANLARFTFLGKEDFPGWPEGIQSTVYEPEKIEGYEQWFWKYQFPLFEQELQA
jgi:sugar (pentulose or hexulose) kinase